MKFPTNQQIQQHTTTVLQKLTPFVIFIVSLVLVTYWAGYTIGRLVHTTNDLLASVWPTRPSDTTEPQQTAPQQTAPPQLIRQDLTVQQLVLQLKADGMSERKIAAQVGISRHKVRTLLMR